MYTLQPQQSYLIWLTGLPCSGKTTIARDLEAALSKSGVKVAVLDGDDLRLGLCKDLGFSRADRKENIRRAGEVARLFLDKGFVVIGAFISPFRSDREDLRKSIPENEFIEVYVNCPLEICERRDVKGDYLLAKNGLRKNFTGVDSPYEVPQNPEIELKTDLLDIETSTQTILNYLQFNPKPKFISGDTGKLQVI